MNIEAKAITKISDIPYFGSIYIEGYWSSNFLEIESYSGVSNFSDDFENTHYFRASWQQSDKGRHGEFREY